MASSELSKNNSFYQLACETTDTFTSCIRIYEALLPYFEAERPGDGVNKRLFNIGGMLTILYNELTTLKNEVTTATAVGDDDNVSKPSVESKGVTQAVNGHNLQENIIYEASTVEQKVSNEENRLNELPKRSWEDVRQVPAEEYQKEKSSHEDRKTDQTISHDEKEHVKPTDNLKKQESDFGYVCGNCNNTITLYNQDLHLSVALHNQDGCYRGKPSKLTAVQKERQEKNGNMVSAQGQVQDLTKYKETTNRHNLTSAQLRKLYKDFSCIQALGNGFICTVCNKKLAGPKNFVEHVRGNYHQNCLKESGKEVQKKTDCETNVTHSWAQLFKSHEKKSPTPVEQTENVPSVDVQLAAIIKHLSGSLYSQMQYLSVLKGAIVCNLCACPIPPTVTNVRDHVLGSRHSKNETELQSLN